MCIYFMASSTFTFGYHKHRNYKNVYNLKYLFPFNAVKTIGFGMSCLPV